MYTKNKKPVEDGMWPSRPAEARTEDTRESRRSGVLRRKGNRTVVLRYSSAIIGNSP